MIEACRYKIVIAEPSIVLANGLRFALDADSECEVIAHFSNLRSLTHKIRQLKPDVILFNPTMISSYKKYQIKKLLRIDTEEPIIALLYSYISSSTLDGFDDSVDILETPKKIIQKVKFTIKKSSLIQKEAPLSENKLSKREAEILISIAQGLKSREIAEIHNISIHTVITHRRNILKKTKIKTISELTLYAMFNKLLP